MLQLAHHQSEDVFFGQDDKAQELEVAQQEVMALRARVKQLESDTHSSSSLELKNLSLQQVTARFLYFGQHSRYEIVCPQTVST